MYFFLPRRRGVVPCALSERRVGCVIGDHSAVFFTAGFCSSVFGIWETLAGFDCSVFGKISRGNE